MAEWVENRLTIEGPEPTIERFVERARGPATFYGTGNPVDAKVYDFSFHALYPVPLNVLQEDYPQLGFDWELDHWGCKWGARESSIQERSPNKVIYAFETPNGPPVLLISSLAGEYDDLKFSLTYEGNEFVGLVNFRQGVVSKSRHRKKANV
jgi:hypothetical protein